MGDAIQRVLSPIRQPAPNPGGGRVSDALVRQMETGHPAPEDRQHDLSGLVASGVCADALGDARRALMIGRYIKSNPHPYTLTCKGIRGGQRYHAHEIHVAVHRILPLIADKLHKLRDPAVARAVLDRWLAEPVAVKRLSMQQTIEALLAEL
jgi:hypothetical protein